MKWVLKTSSIIVGTADGESVFRSLEDCPPEIRRRLRETMPGPDACTITITNRETLEAIRRRTGGHVQTTRSVAPPPKPHWQALELPRWQILAGGLLLTVAGLTGLLLWAMHSR